MSIPRHEYPRPQFVRENYTNLNGDWSFAFDDQNKGLKEKWYEKYTYPMTIRVPFCVESKESQLEIKEEHDIVWYQRTLDLDKVNVEKEYILHFGAVDYYAKVWVNGIYIGEHTGGHVNFSFDVSTALVEGQNIVTVRAEDAFRDLSIPRGKQYWKTQSESIFYTKTTGIWQTVWLEEVSATRLQRVRITPDIDINTVHMEYFLNYDMPNKDIVVETEILFGGNTVIKEQFTTSSTLEKRSFFLKDKYYDNKKRLWTPEEPNLFTVIYRIYKDGSLLDTVESYFGMRKVSINADNILCLNNRPYTMKLVLDQGYFPTGLLTAPTDGDLIKDIELTKEMGFNGVRKHQKVEDPRYLYHCDRMGLLVWGEMANAYDYNEEYARRILPEWQEIITRDYNHPCIVAWVPLNESWGVPEMPYSQVQQEHAVALYSLTKSLDQTRPVVSNDGWEHAKTDLTTVHDYSNSRESFTRHYFGTPEDLFRHKPSNKFVHVPEYPYTGQPILVSEYGGISYKKSEWEGWGYGKGVQTDEDFIARYDEITTTLLDAPLVQGYCYTQLTDVEQEINGLLTYDRQPKVDLSIIKAINEGKYNK